MSEKRRAFAAARVRRIRRIIADATEDPARSRAAVEDAIRQASARQPIIEDTTDRLLARARRRLYDAYQAMRGTGLLVLVMVGLQRARLRLRAQMNAVGFSGASVGLESFGSVLAGATMAVIVISAPAVGTVDWRVEAPVAIHATSNAEPAAPSSLRLSSEAPAEPASVSESSLRRAVSAGVPAPGAPTSTRAEAGVDDDGDRIEISDDRSVEFGGRTYYQRDGTLVWIYCDPESVVKQILCRTYRAIEAHSDEFAGRRG